MKYVTLFILFAFSLLVATCSSNKEITPPSARQISPKEVKGYHAPVEMKVAWFPYKNLQLKQTKANNWVIVKSDSTRQGAIPVIMVSYPETGDSIWIEMDTKNELLGKLIKHTLMTQQPISEPFGEYFETAKCTNCHPADVPVNFDH